MINTINHKKFYVIGVSFEKADALTRGKFTFFPESVGEFTKEAKQKGIESFFVVSTCNRSELYGFAKDAQTLIELYCKYTQGTAEEIQPFVMVKEDKNAVHHLFKVAAGLKSQILGDFEIIAQIKTWFKRFKKHGAADAFSERLVSTAIQISKKVKTETRLTNGAASVSFAAVQYILQTQENIAEKNILLYGIGKIGRNTCTNLVKHTQNDHITLINRTKEKADLMSEKYKVIVKDFNELESELNKTDILIVATGSNRHTITESMIQYDKAMTIIDLSVPENVSHTLASREKIQLVNVDGLSKMVDNTLDHRKSEVPKAESIINDISNDFYDWLKTRELVPAIHSFKERLTFLQTNELQNLQKKNPLINGKETILAEKLVQKLTNQFAAYLKENSCQADDAIALMNDIFHLKDNS